MTRIQGTRETLLRFLTEAKWPLPFEIVSRDDNSVVILIKDRGGMPANPVGRTWMNGMDYRVETTEKSGKGVIEKFMSDVEARPKTTTLYLLDYINGTDMSRMNPNRLVVLRVASETPHPGWEDPQPRHWSDR